MNSSHPYPVFLSLAGRLCVVAGLGSVGRRKLASLLAANADNVLALDGRPLPSLDPKAQALVKDKRVRFENRSFTAEDAAASFLVFAATSDTQENERIADLCRKSGALCNCVTAPQDGDFILPATARQGSLCAALSTAGQSPLLASQWRLELEDWLKPREKLAWLLGRLRAPVLALGNEQAFNSAIFRKIAESPVPHWLMHGDLDHCQDWLKSELPENLHPEINAIFSEFADVFA